MQVPDLEEAVERLRDCAELEDRARERKVERHDEAEEDEDEEHAELQKLALRNGPPLPSFLVSAPLHSEYRYPHERKNAVRHIPSHPCPSRTPHRTQRAQQSYSESPSSHSLHGMRTRHSSPLGYSRVLGLTARVEIERDMIERDGIWLRKTNALMYVQNPLIAIKFHSFCDTRPSACVTRAH
jgi:hypothetical protein